MKIGSLFSGYGGLDEGLRMVLPEARTVWFSEFDKGPSKILAHRFPGVLNHGDITAIDWSQVEPVDVITGGSPCQDLSHAGKRQGMTEGTRSNLWVAMREAIAALRPSLVVWENVRGAYSAAATSDLESDPRLLADTRRRDGEPVLRALGRVLGDLSELGYDASWHGLRAADVGAPHGRFRVFVVAYARGVGGGEGGCVADGFSPDRGRAPAVLDERRGGALLPTPRAGDGEKGGPNQRGSSGDLMLPSAVHQLLPTPAVNDMGASYTPEEWDAWTERMKAEHGNGNGHGKSLHIEAARLLPTPATTNGKSRRAMTASTSNGRRSGGGQSSPLGLDEVTSLVSGHRPEHLPADADLPPASREILDTLHEGQWGQYAAAIQRWEHLTRPAPAPTETGPKGNPRLSAAFSEWMMGLPAGWVTDVPGITRNEALKALGNGVVPQQCAAALRIMLGAEVAA